MHYLLHALILISALVLCTRVMMRPGPVHLKPGTPVLPGLKGPETVARLRVHLWPVLLAVATAQDDARQWPVEQWLAAGIGVLGTLFVISVIIGICCTPPSRITPRDRADLPDVKALSCTGGLIHYWQRCPLGWKCMRCHMIWMRTVPEINEKGPDA